jgi:hypothetical protein
VVTSIGHHSQKYSSEWEVIFVLFYWVTVFVYFRWEWRSSLLLRRGLLFSRLTVRMLCGLICGLWVL